MTNLLDQAATDYVHDLAALMPTAATAWGIPGHDHKLQDFSPAYFEAVAARTKRMLVDVEKLEGDAVTKAVMRDRLGVELQLHEAGENIRAINNIASPVQEIRDTLLQMPEEGRAERLTQVPKAVAGYRESLAMAASKSMIAPARQIAQLRAQLTSLVGNSKK